MKKLSLFIILLAFSCSIMAQSISPSTPACANQTLTYTYTPHVNSAPTVNVTWTVNGGVFIDHGNATTYSTTANIPLRVKWNSNFSGGSISAKQLYYGQELVTSVTIKAVVEPVASVSGPGLGSIPCGSTSQVTFAVYVNIEGPSQYHGTLDGPQSVVAPSGWQVLSKTYQDRPNVNGTDYYRYIVVLQPDATTGGNITFRNSHDCSGTWAYSGTPHTFYVSRAPVAYSITGPYLICNTGSYSISSSYSNLITGINWTSGSNLNITSGQTSTTVQVQYAQNGSSFIKASISDVCGNANNEQQVNNWAGSPIISSPGYYLFDSGSNTWQVYSNPNAGATYSYAVSSGSASLSPTGSSCYVTTSDGATVCQTATNSCGSVSYCFDVPAGGGYMRSVSPNPAKDQLTLQFTDTKSVESLPSDVYLYGENSTKAVKVISIKDVYDRKAFVDVDKLNVSVGDLPRGTYYLHVVPNKESNRPTQKIRIILE